ncbi:coiled-coil domain-containing protein [Longispora urticae]
MSLRRRVAALMAVVMAATLLAGAPAQADPEGGTKALRDALEAASKGYQDAKTAIANAKKRQGELSVEVTNSEAKVKDLVVAVGRLAAAQYRGGTTSELNVLLNSTSADSYLQSASTMRYMSERDARSITDLKKAQAALTQQRKDLDAAINEQEAQLKELKKRQEDALKALRNAGGGDPTLGFGELPAGASPAPRNPDGSWPSEGCSVKDPTTGGCISPRTLHAYNETKKAGFNHFVSCYRSGEDGGEHPRGRACDWAANTSGFQDVDASGADREYGNRLAAWYISNADRLAVLYVIWYRQIWMPGTGWRSYSGGGGPAAAHTNHVHLSIR